VAEIGPGVPETKTPEELGRQAALREEALRELGVAGPEVKVEAMPASAVVDKAKEAEAARTRISDVPLAEEMAHIENQGHDKAKAITTEAQTEAERVATQAERSARTLGNKRNRNEAAAKTKIDGAMVQVDTILGRAKVEADRAVPEAQADAEALKDAYTEERSKDRITDKDVAWEAAHAEKASVDQALVVEQAAKTADSERDKARYEGLAAELRQQGTEAGQSAAQAESTRLDALDKAMNEQFKSSSEKIRSLGAGAEPGVMRPIGVSDQVTSEMVATLAGDLQRSLGVNFDTAPLDSALRGRLFGQKFIDVYRQSADSSLRGVVFVESYDKKTGRIVRLDAVAAPRPEKPEVKPGKSELGPLDKRRWQRAERKWRQTIEEELIQVSKLPDAPSADHPFLPGDPKLARRKSSGGTTTVGAYPDILTRNGMSPEVAQKVKKPKRRGFWFNLWGI
jgi:hypothetical protein